jgi:hypothetical protein
MPTFVHYIPIITTFLSVAFGTVLFKHWRRKPDANYLFWWFLGVAMYGLGTFTESMTTLFGWQEVIFKSWYISGALLGGAPLAQGTVYLLFRKKVADRMSVVLVLYVLVASVCIVSSPIDWTMVESFRLSGKALEWSWVRMFSPFINSYAFIFLVGGAVWSAIQYARKTQTNASRMWGNILIAVGGLLPGIGGTSARFGMVEVLYVTEFLGLLIIWAGYRAMAKKPIQSIHANQKSDV